MSKRSEAGASAIQTSELEVPLSLKTIRMRYNAVALVSLGVGAYALATPGGSHRTAILAVAAYGTVAGLVLRFLPAERLVRSSWRETLFVFWGILGTVGVAALAALDGGVTSPFTILFVLPVLFAAISSPLRVAAIVGTFNVAAFLAVALASGDSLAYALFTAFGLLCVAVVSVFAASSQMQRRNDLAATAKALRASEEVQRWHARQQAEVARFGQRALGGEGIDELLRESLRVVERVLDIDMAGIVRVLPEEQALEVVAGLPENSENIGMKLPTGTGSHTGYTLATGTPVIVRDWDTETRFSRLQQSDGMKSGLSVMIRTANRTFGVLIVQCGRTRDFGTREINFMQSVANVIGNAIERREEEERARYDALHDPLTGLANRNLFIDHLGQALVDVQRRRNATAVFLMDLDQFKLVNDSLGHAAGDELLAAVAPRLEQALRPTDTIARLGGDEFAVLAEVKTERDALHLVERIKVALAQPFKLRDREHFVSASMGISISSGDKAAEVMVRDADAALYRAKEKGRGSYEIFDSAMRARALTHMRIENDLRLALDRGEFELHYQPIVGLRDGSIVALEALLRWRHPEYGLTSPSSFVPVAEESQLILPIGRWVIEEACARIGEWQSLRTANLPLRIAVNLSGRQIGDPLLLPAIAGAIEASGIEPATLSLELTETVLFEESGISERIMRSLRAMGVRLALDDFGSGFSSLGYLKRFPLDGIKLDRSFIENVADGLTDAQIVRAVVEMARALGLEIVAEGVETAEQLAAVGGLGCHQAQGFYFMPPIPAAEVPGVLRQSPWRGFVARMQEARAAPVEKRHIRRVQ